MRKPRRIAPGLFVTEYGKEKRTAARNAGKILFGKKDQSANIGVER